MIEKEGETSMGQEVFGLVNDAFSGRDVYEPREAGLAQQPTQGID